MHRLLNLAGISSSIAATVDRRDGEVRLPEFEEMTSAVAVWWRRHRRRQQLRAVAAGGESRFSIGRRAAVGGESLFVIGKEKESNRREVRSKICCVHLNLIELHHIRPVLSHSVCGHPVVETCDGVVQCSFCHLSCESELMRCFHLEVNVADESSNVFAWSTGQTASELLQISPDEFYELPEDEQAMYLYTLENEKFMVSIVNSDQSQERHSVPSIKERYPIWEITRAQKL